MARPHVEFMQSQSLAWVPSPWRHLPGCQVKLLSRDPADGAAVFGAIRRWKDGFRG